MTQQPLAHQNWFHDLRICLEGGKSVMRVVLIRAEGSTPREMGADMMVYDDYITGTIGGGTLELEAITTAREIMATPRQVFRSKRQYPLGPTLGQCCGGFVEVLFEHITPEDIDLWQSFEGAHMICHPEDAHLPPSPNAEDKSGIILPLSVNRTPLYLYGAGHIGRALMAITAGLPLDRHWIDTDVSRFPDDIPEGVERIIAANPAQIAAYAPKGAIHLVMSYSHQMDLDICLAVLQNNTFGRLGLIGSQTKKARFLKALKDAGISDHLRESLICPIGLEAIGGKEPARVALSIAGQLSEWTRNDQLEHHNADNA